MKRDLTQYPAELVVTAEDFDACGWRDALGSAGRDCYSSMWHPLSQAARKAMEDGRLAHGKVLWLLAEICSMRLLPASTNEPFKPQWESAEARATLPDDFTAADLSFLAEIAERVDDSRLKGRLADLLWLRTRPKQPAHALMAIDAYRSLPLEPRTWLGDGRKCWERAFRLARVLREAAGERAAEMEESVLATFNAEQHENKFFSRWLAELMLEHGLGRTQRPSIAARLEALGRAFDAAGDLHTSRSYFEHAASWFRACGDKVKSTEMTAAEAETWAKEARLRSAGDGVGHLVAATFYENAIQVYRTIPRALRADHRVEERMDELRTLLAEEGQMALGEMAMVRTPGVDISEIVASARDAVRSKPPLEALRSFAQIYNGVRVETLRESVLKTLREFPLQALFGSTMMSRDGRTIAKQPAMGFESQATQADIAAVNAAMVRDHGTVVQMVVQGSILPALEVLVAEHRFQESDFEALARGSPIVPKDRARLFAKALFAGFERDFVQATHILVPQVEQMVRHHLKAAGAKTTNLDRNGIENENGLSTLMELPQAEQVFGPDLAFEIRALFCDPVGPNLRNELAHGLMDEEACQTIFTVYAWWFILRLVFLHFWNAHHKSGPPAADETPADGGVESA